MRVRRWRWVAITVVLVIGAVVWRAAGDGEGSRQYAKELVLLDGLIPARAGVTLGPGTPIARGFEVAEGSYLLGSVWPTLYSTMHGGDPIEDDGFFAWLLVTEPLGEVLERYRTQAVNAGYVMTPVECTTSESDQGVVDCSTSCAVRCDFGAETGYAHGRELGFGGRQGVVSPDQPPMSYMGVYYREMGDPPYPGLDSYDPPSDGAPKNPGTVPTAWPALPDVGDQIHSFNDFEVAPGTVLLAHGLSSNSAETSAIFEVVDDIDDVIERFTAQPEFPPHPPDEPTQQTWERGGFRLVHLYWSDGHSQNLEFHDPPEGPTILVLTSYVAD